MTEIVSELLRYGTILLVVTYTIVAISLVRDKGNRAKNPYAYVLIGCMFLLQFFMSCTAYIMTLEVKIIWFYLAQVVYMAVLFILFRILYAKGSIVLLTHMSMLITIGLAILTRLSFNKAVRQFEILVFGTVAAGLIPFIMSKFKLLRKMAWFYGSIGIGLLLLVLLIAENTYGAKLSIEIFDVAFQPSEFVKIVFVFFVAAMFEHGASFSQVVKTSIMAAAHVLILVASKDLGSALIYAIVYVVMVYIATGNALYLFGGLLGGSAASYVAYTLFDHVKTRVTAWMDPWSVIDDKGYQVAQSLFSIATGGWFGLGLYKGSPGTIPVVEEDFVFAAICEELGVIIAICVIVITFLCVRRFFKAAMDSYGNFYRFMALGLGATYGIQVFITIGGAIKLIPSTGVTLPLISYGGSSLLSTIAMFAIVQGIIILKRDEDEKIEREKERKRQERQRQKLEAERKANLKANEKGQKKREGARGKKK